MAEIQLTRGYVALIDDEDFEQVAIHHWHPRRTHNSIYAHTAINGRSVDMHRLLMGEPEGKEVDHINGNGLDNRRSENLRVVSHSQNQRNQRNRVWKYGLPGVGKRRSGKWIARCVTNGVAIYLGLFSTKEAAHAAYLSHLQLINDPRHGLTLPEATT